MKAQSAQPKLMPIAEAIPKLLGSLPRMVETEVVPLRVAVGRIVGTDVFADLNVPPHGVSAMDGYAVRSAELNRERIFSVSQRIAAGEAGDAVCPGGTDQHDCGRGGLAKYSFDAGQRNKCASSSASSEASISSERER